MNNYATKGSEPDLYSYEVERQTKRICQTCDGTYKLSFYITWTDLLILSQI